jgi:hypothetical protein
MMPMEARIDASFQTLQRDLFASGLAADIGMHAFGVWLAIKTHADYNTGEAWPGMRRLAKLTGLSVGSVQKGVHRLVEARLLRVLKEAKGSNSRRGNTYIACERLDVRLGTRVLCTIVLDYVPATLRSRIEDIEDAMRKGKPHADVFADCEILPGPGFQWDSASNSLRASIPVTDLPPTSLSDDQMRIPLVKKMLAMREGQKARKP